MSQSTFDTGARGHRWARMAVPLALALAVIWAIWTLAHLETGIRREAAPISTIIPVEQPPPPPPPKTPPPPEPRPVPMEVPQPTPATQPRTPAPTQPTQGQDAVTENAPAQAGSDAFNIGSGSGSGGRGAGGIGGAETAGAYGEYAKGRIVQAIRADRPLQGKPFRSEVRVWFDGSGRVTRVEVVRGTGVGAYDAEIKRVLLALAGLRPPQAATMSQMPIHFAIDERFAS